MPKGYKPKAGFDTNPQNINKKGRPIAGESYKEIIARLEAEDYFNPKTGESMGNAKELLAKAWLTHAIRGSVGHLKEWLDRKEGKVPIPIKEITDDVLDLEAIRKTILDISDETE